MPRGELGQGRAALSQKEKDKRAAALRDFRTFLGDVDLDVLCAAPARCAAALEAYGRDVYRQVPRRLLGDYLAAVLAVADHRRDLRGRLSQAWDFAAVWKMEEPGTSNLAIPAIVLRAFVTTALFWGWPRFAALTAIGFGGLLRPSEFLLATRRLLVLPSDIQGTWFRSYLRVPVPKSRWAAARRQLARIDEWWVTALAARVFGGLPLDARLWPAFPAAYRRRWNAVATALGLDFRTGLTPASLRAGGATAHYEAFEDSEKLRRHRRWQKQQMVDIYVQEVAPSEFFANLAPGRRLKLFRDAQELNGLLAEALRPPGVVPSASGGP